MKPPLPRMRSVAQTDLFDAANARAPLTFLQRHRDEIVALLSQLLWQVAIQIEPDQRPEQDDEQDQP